MPDGCVLPIWQPDVIPIVLPDGHVIPIGAINMLVQLVVLINLTDLFEPYIRGVVTFSHSCGSFVSQGLSG